MIELPPEIASAYVPAAGADVRSLSFGAVGGVRRGEATTWEEASGTLGDQRIFGPRRDLHCACGKYAGHRHVGVICDRCGVKIGPAVLRRTRAAHINLSKPIPHPLCATRQLDALPVLPASFWESPADPGLAELYDAAIQANSRGDAEKTGEVFAEICQRILPALLVAHNWNLLEASTIAHGLALVEKSPPPDNVD